MKPRTLIAVQFAIWAFFFSRIIPFSGDILLPVVWIYDRRIFAGFLLILLIDLIRALPVMFAIPEVQKALQMLPPESILFIVPATLLLTSLEVSLNVWILAWFLKRKIKKLAPDLVRFHS